MSELSCLASLSAPASDAFPTAPSGTAIIRSSADAPAGAILPRVEPERLTGAGAGVGVGPV
ncbi:hypothetical protein [Ancylobacter lacus]|uniref:hypothetical protein n=1 Tax=Ancylobacter lacus TaxID=2579970 RepID=UPI001BCDA6C1|nr:hypothetical protein [Ancylobacter lacus]MBS7539394.1 hypothetical protein [Ancylobacter lacus]